MSLSEQARRIAAEVAANTGGDRQELRQAFEIHGAAQVKRCVGYRGVWYAWI